MYFMLFNEISCFHLHVNDSNVQAHIYVMHLRCTKHTKRGQSNIRILEVIYNHKTLDQQTFSGIGSILLIFTEIKKSALYLNYIIHF